MTTLTRDTDYGVGYAHDEFAGTTASRERLEQLARLAYGYGSPEEYRYTRPSDDDAPSRPGLYPTSLDAALRADLRQCRTWDQAAAVVAMKACQIAQTGYAGPKRRATPDEREWAHMAFAASRASEQLARVPGTCRGCNSDPCRCLA